MNSFGKKFLQVPADAGDAPQFGDILVTVPDNLPRAAVAQAAADDSFPRADLAVADSTTLGVDASTGKPVATIAQLADYLVNGFWTFNKTIAHHWASPTISYNIDGLNAAEQFLAQSALNAWHEVANVSFVRTSGTANITFNHNGTMVAVTNAGWNGLGQISSATVDISADWITNDGGAKDGKTGIDSYGYQTYIHEIGHALGLGHQGPYNGTATYGANATYADDTWQYSIMSYFSQGNYSGSTSRYVVTPQMADIYAVDSIYGAAVTRSGDTVYGFHSTAGSIFDFSAYSPAPALTIYDSGGNDTLDCSGYSVAQTIDLHAGSFSSVGGLVNNIGIATNANIENAIGGSGNDTLIANDFGCTLTGGGGSDTLIGGASGDRLVGGSGKDAMTGGGGADVFVFAPGDSVAVTGLHDLISDFQSGVDHIDLTGMDAITATAAYDAFRFMGTSAFDGTAGELDYSFDGSRGVTVVQGDTNGDRVADFAIDLAGNVALGNNDFYGTVLSGVVIETSGTTSLTQIGNNYYFTSGGAGPSLKYAGAAVTAGQFTPYTPVAVEQTSSGYQLAWQNSSADQFSIWSTDFNGNVTSYSVVPGHSAALESLELFFHQDLNGDGVIGAVTNTIEASGNTSLTEIGNNYYFGGGTGPSLKYAGAAVTAGQFTPYTPVAVEQTSSGYQVAWKNSSADQFSIWSTDFNGNVTSYTEMPGHSVALESLEPFFHQDLNGDGLIGAVTSTIEASGNTSLTEIGNNYYFGGAAGPELKYAGAAVTAGQFTPYTPVAVEQTSSGYQLAWQNSSADQFSIWSTDFNGNVTSYSEVAGHSAGLESLEPFFHQDLNGDGVIGAVTSTIEASGNTSLTEIGNNYYFGGGTGPALKYAGAAVAAGQFTPYTPVAAERTSSGYEVAWKDTSSDQFSIWNTDLNGNVTSYNVVPGHSAALESLEPFFHQDLNGDGVTGVPTAAATVGAGASFNFATTVADPVASIIANAIMSAVGASGSDPAQWVVPHPVSQLVTVDAVPDHHDIIPSLNLHLVDMHAGTFIIS